jgi:uncharacterized membrane protein
MAIDHNNNLIGVTVPGEFVLADRKEFEGMTRGEIFGIAGHALATLALVVVFFVRMDMATSILWFGGFLVFAWSFVRLVRELFGKRVLARIFVALASIVLFPLACVNLIRATGDAHSATRTVAERAQAACDKDERCPSIAALCGHEPANEYDSECITAGSAGIRFRVRYRVATDGKSFGVWTPISIDE